MSLSNCEAALIQAYKAGAFFTDANTQFENLAFTPPSATPWAAFYFVPAQPVVATLGAGGSDMLDGFVQIDLNYPANKGTKEVRDKAEALRSVFTAGARFSYSGQEVVIVSCGRSQGRIINGFYRVSVTIVFYAHINRN